MSDDSVSSPAPAPEGLRPLPVRPNIEFERKRAKALLDELRRGNPDAKLSDAQFSIARDYGFMSWPRLVQYYAAVQQDSEIGGRRGVPEPIEERLEKHARRIMADQQTGRNGIGLQLAAYIPRFFGRSTGIAQGSPITLDEARLVLAREYHAPSWEALLASYAENQSRDSWAAGASPQARSHDAMIAGDLDALKAVVMAHPEVMERTFLHGPHHSLLSSAIQQEWEEPGDDARAVTEWLVSAGGDLRDAATRMLLGGLPLSRGGLYQASSRRADGIPPRPEDYVRYLLTREADPSWMPPSGIPVLEYALVRYWSGAAVDELLRHVEPRRAFWITAGIGDVAGTRRYFDRDGSLRQAARAHRPNFRGTAGPQLGFPSAPGADDNYVIWEAALVAMLNQRLPVLDLLLHLGFEVDAAPVGVTLLQFAVWYGNLESAEFLIARGAKSDTYNSWGNSTVMESAESALKGAGGSWDLSARKRARRIYELCGGTDADGVLRRHEEERSPAVLGPPILEIVELAKGEAARLGRARVEPDNLFIALLSKYTWYIRNLAASGMDMDRFRGMIADRLAPLTPDDKSAVLPLGEETTRVLETARLSKRSDSTQVTIVLVEILTREEGAVARMIVEAGGSLPKLRAAMERTLRGSH